MYRDKKGNIVSVTLAEGEFPYVVKTHTGSTFSITEEKLRERYEEISPKVDIPEEPVLDAPAEFN